MRAHCRGLVVALCVLALVPVAADSRQDRERADWLEASNKALERELALARAELLERAGGRAFEDDAGGAGGGDREGSVKDLSSKLEQMGAEVERLTTINAELRQLLDQEQGGDGGLDGVEGGKEALALADADVRLEMHTKVVGSSPKSKDDESFLLDLATAKLAQGDLGTAAGLYRSHLALFTGTAAARSAAARRMLLLMQGHARSRAGRHLASHMVADKSSAQVLLDIAGELEKEALVGENRRAASALLELYLSHHSWSADAWHRLGRLRERDGRLVEALSCFQQASTLAPLDAQLAASYLAVNEEIMSQAWLPPRAPHVYVMQSATSEPEQATALRELHAALAAAGVRAVLVVPPVKAASKKKGSRAPSAQAAPEMPPARPMTGRTGSVASWTGQGAPLSGTHTNTTLSLPAERLEAGDLVVFPASRPPPAQWMHAARLRQALLVSWSFSWRDVTADVSSSGLDALPQPLWLHWHAGMVGHVMEGDSVRDTGSGGAVDAWIFRVAASHSILMSSSAPAGALLVPPLPAQSHSVEEDARAGLTVRAPSTDGRSAEHHKEDTILCRGLRRKCLAVIHDTLAALPGSGFCPVPLAILVDVHHGSPAHGAGLMAGDALLAVGVVAGGVGGDEDALEAEVQRAKDQVVRVSVRRQHHAGILSLDVTPHVWQGDGLLGWTLDFNRTLGCASGDEDLFAMPGSLTGSRPRPLRVVNVPHGWGAEHLRPLLVSAKVLVHQSSWEARGVGDSLGAVELEAALYDVCILVPSDAAAAVDWPIGSKLVFEPHVDARSMPTLLLDTLRDYDGLSAERGVLKDYIKGLPAALSSASHSLVQSSQRLFYTVALDVRDEAAACSFIVSARLSHPMATVEVLVRDVQAFYHTHAALILQLKERGLWNGVWLSQIPSAALEQISASHLPQTSRLYVSLLSRPLALHAGRGYQMACLVDPHLVMLPHPPGGLLDKLAEYPWSSAPYMASTHKGVMRLPLCFRPSALHSKLARATLSPPAGAEAAGKYLYRCMLSMAGFAMHKRLGDTNAILDSLGAMLLSTISPHDVPKLSGAEKEQLEQLVAHPAWAATQAYLSPERRAAINLVVQGTQTQVVECKAAEGLSGSADGEEDAALESDEQGQQPLEQEVKELRQRVSTLQRKLSEAKRLEQGWQTVAMTTEKELAELRTLHASPAPGAEAADSTRSSASAAPPPHGTHTVMQPHVPGTAGVENGNAALPSNAALSKSKSIAGASGRGDGRSQAAHAGREAVGQVPNRGNGSKTADHTESKLSGMPSAQAAVAPAASTKIVVLSGRVAASRKTTTGARDESAAQPVSAPPVSSTASTQEGRGDSRSAPEELQTPKPAEDERAPTQPDQNVSSVTGDANKSMQPAAARDNASAHSGLTCQTDTLERSASDDAENASTPELAPMVSSVSVNDPIVLPGGVDKAPRTEEGAQDDPSRPGHGEARGECEGASATERAAADAQNANSQDGRARLEGTVSGASQELQQDLGPGAAGAHGTKYATAEAEGAAGNLGALVAEERMVLAAVERLAREDAEDEQFRRHAKDAAARLESTDNAHSDQAPADTGVHVPTTPCPPGFRCSDTAPIDQDQEAQGPAATSASPSVDAQRAKREGGDGAFSAGPAESNGRGSPGPPEVDARSPAEDSGSNVGGGHGGPAVRPVQAEEVQDDVGESLLLAQRAAQFRAEALKAGRSMITARDKHDNVAQRDEEILRAARRAEAHPMFRRAVSAAAARTAPSPSAGPTPADPRPADQPDADPRLSAAEPSASRAVTHSGPVLATDEMGSGHTALGPTAAEPPAPSNSSAGLPSVAAAGHVPEATLTATEPPASLEKSAASPRAGPTAPAPSASNPQMCGLGIGVGAAPHGAWKVAKVVAGGSVDRANGSAPMRVQAGDILVSVDDVLLSGVSAADLSKLVKGADGSQVTLQFRSLQDASLHSISVNRSCQ